MKRRIAILGSTGSIGTQALDIISQHPDRFEVTALSAHSQTEALFEQVRRHRPKLAALTSKEVQIPDDLRFCDWYFGENALTDIASLAPCEDVLVSVVGMVGLRSVLAARKASKRVLLANKEALVAGGQLVMDACKAPAEDPALIPVDSEHSAIYQALLSANGNPFERIILTASGGPFRTWTLEEMKTARLSDALKHPNWEMGQKITIDSATMFNKALEIIEAKWLFDAKPQQIEVLVHPQSIIHSLVGFKDGALLAQLGMPDMRSPIAFAMAFPERISNGTPSLRLELSGNLSFEAPDLVRFPAIRLAYESLNATGAACCILNAANEIAVEAFIQGKIGFLDIALTVEQVLHDIGYLSADSLDDILYADDRARTIARGIIPT
ncbi:MAG: 1-deoxy-D-xylulose-5-phosphate reductoisomerase [Clostridiales bacterium]|nr:1-deoxy-D-xylulose-5-phosphate reductoisomerase [Clostridiales bacterium]